MTQDEFLLKDYELKITYLTDHFQRMWTRFNFFVTIESALIGGNFLLQKGGFDPKLGYAGIVLSLFWYLMGAEDRYLVRLYRYQVEKAGEAVAAIVWESEEARKKYRHVGQVNKAARKALRQHERIDEQGREKSFWKRFMGLSWLTGWRWSPISTTRLAAWIPLTVLLLWALLLICSKK